MSRPRSTAKTQSTCTFPEHPAPFAHPDIRSWGRILAATGSIPLSTPLDPTRVSVSFIPADGSSPLALLVNGEPEKVDEVRAKEIVSLEDLEVRVELGLGNESAKYWRCDFSYVSILSFSNIPQRDIWRAYRTKADGCFSFCNTGVCQDQRRLQELSTTAKDCIRINYFFHRPAEPQ